MYYVSDRLGEARTQSVAGRNKITLLLRLFQHACHLRRAYKLQAIVLRLLASPRLFMHIDEIIWPSVGASADRSGARINASRTPPIMYFQKLKWIIEEALAAHRPI